MDAVRRLRRFRCNSILLAALIPLAAACGEARPAAKAVTVVDSAGVRIVVNGAPALPRGSWTVSHHPAVVIGWDERDENQILHRVVGAVALSDGRVVVGSGAEPMLRWYDVAGDFVTGAVQAGGGPGELQTGWIHRFWPLPGDSVAYLYHRPDGTFGGAIAELPFLEMFQIEVRFPFSAEALPTEGQPPFARGAATAVHGDRFYHGDQETYEVAVYGLDGALRTRIRKDVPNRPVTAAIRRADRERRLETDAVSGDGPSSTPTVGG